MADHANGSAATPSNDGSQPTSGNKLLSPSSGHGDVTLPASDGLETYSLSESHRGASPEIEWASQPTTVKVSPQTLAEVETAKRFQTPGTNARFVLLGCNALVFMTSVCVMVLELTASRLIAKHVGSSLYTWTSVIGVVLAGITIGNFLGGWLADRFAPGKLLNWLFLAASVLCLSVLWLDGLMVDRARPEGWQWPTWVVWVVGIVFFFPSMSLGTISPVVASLALSQSRKVGATVGNVYAWGALGSIVGTFLTGFILIDTMGTRAIVALTAGTLASMGVLAAAGKWTYRATVLFGWMQFVTWIGLTAAITDGGMKNVMTSIGRTVTRFQSEETRDKSRRLWTTFGESLGRRLHELGLTLGLRDDRVGEYHDESNYSYINVSERTEDGDRVKVLRLDKLVHSYLVQDNPTQLNYEYEKVYAAVTEQAVAGWSRQTSVSLGDIQRTIEQRRQEISAAKAASAANEASESTQKPAVDIASASSGLDEAIAEKLTTPQASKAAKSPSDDPAQEAKKLPTLAEICQQFPSWITLDAEKNEIFLRGGMTPDRREQLLRLHPYHDYWRAIERLQEMTRSGEWGDFGTVPLERLPEGIVIPDELKEKVLYDRHLQSLNCYRSLDEHDLEILEQLGAFEAVTYFEAVDRLYRESRRVSTLFLGGGGFIFPRWVEAKFPQDPVIHVAELDPAVKAAVQTQMGLPADGDTRVVTTIGDARNFVDDRVRANEAAKKRGEKPVLYDFVYGDAFNDFSVPWHLTTKEFSEKIARLVHPTEGIYQVNLIDIYPRTVFPAKDSSAVVEGGIPETLSRALFDKRDWQNAPKPFAGLEIKSLAENAGYRLSVRGVMSNPLRDQLLKLGESHIGFVDAIQQLHRESRKAQTGRFLGAYVNTISRVFPNVYLFSSESDSPHDSRDTFVIVASKKHLDLSDLSQNSGHWQGAPFASLETDSKGKLIASGQMNEVLANAHGIVLTDDFAPVDNLLSTVFDAR